MIAATPIITNDHTPKHNAIRRIIHTHLANTFMFAKIIFFLYNASSWSYILYLRSEIMVWDVRFVTHRYI